MFRTKFYSSINISYYKKNSSLVPSVEPPADEKSVDNQGTAQTIAVIEELATQSADTQNSHVQEDIAVTELADDSKFVTQNPPARDTNNEATTKQPSSHPLEPATKTATATKGPTMLASLQQENEFLKAEIQVYK